VRLNTIKEIKGTIIIRSGLHIGGSKDEIKIGGIDNPVIKNPFDNEPYIPGSSLKGKIRSLLEWQFGTMTEDGKPTDVTKNYSDNALKIAKLFGNGSTIQDKKLAKEIGPTRISFADCNLRNKKDLLERNALTEEKIEVTINRLTGSVGGGGPRHMERVPSGAKFAFSVTLMKLENDEDFEPILALGMKLLELTNLGGSGSRGYGKIEFCDIKGMSEELVEDGKLKSYEELKSKAGL